ncbi:MAG TPA: YadA-like family protein, partial [Sphingomicrobium sp.]|nr:YadA-like family protein [Sphingomicrobium sp.]
AATARVVTGVAAGTLSATSLDAVNGSQLFATNQTVATHTTQIAGLQQNVVDLGLAIDRVDRRNRGGTAVAIAMGGATFLPGTTFNLTGNVGTYRGAWAGALNLGAMVSPNAAVNAGIGSGFNRDGKVGARAGFTFGW